MKKNYIYTLLLTIFNIIFPILSFPYISRILGPTGVGKVQFVITFAQYFALIAALGIPYYGVREIARVRLNNKELSKTFSELLFIYVITSVLISVVYIIVVMAFTRFSANMSYYLPSLLIVLLGFSSIDWFYQGIEEFKSIALRSIFIKLICLIMMYILVKTIHDALLYLYITIFSVLGNNIINMVFLRNKVSIGIKKINLRKHLKPLFYIFGANLSIAMYNMLDTILLGLLSNDKSVGYYTASTKITRIAMPLVVSIGAVLLPEISASFHNKDDRYKELLATSYSFIILLAVPITFALFLLAPELIHLVSGNAFSSAIVPMQILSVLPVFIGMGNLLGVQVLISSGREREMLKSVMVGMVLSIALNIALVPKTHEVGAAIANSVTELIVSCVFYYFVKKAFGITFSIKTFFYSILSCLPFIPIIYLLRKSMHSEILLLGVSAISCSFVYFVIKYFFLKDIYTSEIIDKVKVVFLTRLGLKNDQKNSE
ncbi:flippase [Mucilaginibacter sp.]|uniref:flippase n=1 Tax=Mucilaginibacter sp. TaxID=1882438 RepID=UPI00283AF879|nr:flippase [Mucilaginibacter sp.]MDR3694922.1 flippase [Mucilaginibacter sp.]